jgi:hypothetical protein
LDGKLLKTISEQLKSHRDVEREAP